MFKAIALVLLCAAPIAAADEDPQNHDHAHDPHHAGLFFGNALIGETPSPHSELRLKYILDHDSSANTHTFEAGIELAFARWISVEFEIPYAIVDADEDSSDANGFDNLAFALKLASFAFEERGVLLGGGIEFELPTGDEEDGIGSDHLLVIEPFLTAGLKQGLFAIIARAGFAMPVNEERQEKHDVDLAIVYHVAIFWHASDQLTFLLEFDGESIAAGDETENLLNISPGIKLRPFDSDVEIGAAVSFPVLDDPGFDVRLTFAIYFHF